MIGGSLQTDRARRIGNTRACFNAKRHPRFQEPQLWPGLAFRVGAAQIAPAYSRRTGELREIGSSSVRSDRSPCLPGVGSRATPCLRGSMRA